MAVTRPLKEGSVTTYQAKVTAGFPDILASEMDADLDTIYAAWNGGVATANLIDGSVTTPKLATAPNGVATANLNDLAVTTAKLATGAVTLAKLGVGAVVRQVVTVPVPANIAITTTGSWLDLVTGAITTSGGLVLVIATPGWWTVGNTSQVNSVLTGLARDQVTPNIGAAGERRFQVNATGQWVVPLPMLAAVDAAPAGAHTYHLVVFNAATGVQVITATSWPGSMWLVELA